MKLNRIALMIFSLMIITATVLSACSPSTTPTTAPLAEATEAPAVATEAPAR